MGPDEHSIIIVTDDDSVEGLINISSALGNSVVAVDSKEDFLAVYTSSVRCIVLELSLPDFCGVEIIRHLADVKCQAALVLITDTSAELLEVANRLAIAFGIHVVDALMKPFDPERLMQSLITAMDPLSAKGPRSGPLQAPSCPSLPQDYSKDGCSGSCQ